VVAYLVLISLSERFQIVLIAVEEHEEEEPLIAVITGAKARITSQLGGCFIKLKAMRTGTVMIPQSPQDWV
jgi:hypothetical protein